MLASMVTARRPTRAEVTDVANAIYDGTDAVMLSEETAVGQNPVEAVRVMDRIARATEPDLPYGEWLFTRTDQATQDVADSVAQSAVGAVYRLGLKALVVPTDERPHRPPRLRPPAQRAGAGDLAADRDGAPAQPALRRHRGAERHRDRAARPARATAPRSPPSTASPRPAT